MTSTVTANEDNDVSVPELSLRYIWGGSNPFGHLRESNALSVMAVAGRQLEQELPRPPAPEERRAVCLRAAKQAIRLLWCLI